MLKEAKFDENKHPRNASGQFGSGGGGSSSSDDKPEPKEKPEPKVDPKPAKTPMEARMTGRERLEKVDKLDNYSDVKASNEEGERPKRELPSVKREGVRDSNGVKCMVVKDATPEQDASLKFTLYHDSAVRMLDRGMSKEDVAAAYAKSLQEDGTLDEWKANLMQRFPHDYHPEFGGKEPTPEHFVEVAARAHGRLNDAIEAQGGELNGPVHRGLHGLSLKQFHELIGQDEMSFGAVSSTSRDFNLARQFGEGNPEKGTYGVVFSVNSARKALGIENASHIPGEAEVLIGKGERFRIAKVTRVGSHSANVELEVI
jgi:hypothetical protein